MTSHLLPKPPLLEKQRHTQERFGFCQDSLVGSLTPLQRPPLQLLRLAAPLQPASLLRLVSPLQPVWLLRPVGQFQQFWHPRLALLLQLFWLPQLVLPLLPILLLQRALPLQQFLLLLLAEPLLLVLLLQLVWPLLLTLPSQPPLQMVSSEGVEEPCLLLKLLCFHSPLSFAQCLDEAKAKQKIRFRV